MPNIYAENDVKIWEKLFEEIGSFYGVEIFLKEKGSGSGPGYQTIKNRIIRKFKRENRDFNKWINTYSKQIQTKDYSSKEELDYLKKMFEHFGSFKQVENQIKKTNEGKGPNRRTIKSRLREKFEEEGKDFNSWVKIHYKGTRPDSNYSFNDLQNWEDLYERIGSFRGVEVFIKENNSGEGPYYTTIIKNLQKKFIKEGRDYNKWVNLYYTGIKPLNGYSDNEYYLWEKLYEQFVSFDGVSNFLRRTNNGKGPTAKTVKKMLINKFGDEERDFEVWAQQFSKDYKEKDELAWEQLYEKIGSFNGIEKMIKANNNGVGPTKNTIKRRLRARFEQKNQDFDKNLLEFKYFKLFLRTLLNTGFKLYSGRRTHPNEVLFEKIIDKIRYGVYVVFYYTIIGGNRKEKYYFNLELSAIPLKSYFTKIVKIKCPFCQRVIKNLYNFGNHFKDNWLRRDV